MLANAVLQTQCCEEQSWAASAVSCPRAALSKHSYSMLERSRWPLSSTAALLFTCALQVIGKMSVKSPGVLRDGSMQLFAHGMA